MGSSPPHKSPPPPPPPPYNHPTVTVTVFVTLGGLFSLHSSQSLSVASSRRGEEGGSGDRHHKS